MLVISEVLGFSYAEVRNLGSVGWLVGLEVGGLEQKGKQDRRALLEPEKRAAAMWNRIANFHALLQSQ